MKRTWMGASLVGAILSSGCATITGAAMASLGAEPEVSEASTYERGPTYGTGTVPLDHHSLADGFGRISLPVAALPPDPLNTGRALPVLEPGDSPLVESGVLGAGMKGLPADHLRRLGLRNYAKNWAEAGLGSSLQDVQNGLYAYLQLAVFRGGSGRLLLK